MSRRDALVRVIDALHAEIVALKANDVGALERATQTKLAAIEAVAAASHEILDAEIKELAREADRLNETARIYVNLMAANVRRRLQDLTGAGGNAYAPGRGIAAYA